MEFATTSTLRKANSKRHMENHLTAQSKFYVCPVCGKNVRSLHSLRRHIRKLHPENALAIDKRQTYCDSSSFQCGVCHYKTLRKASLKRHMETHVLAKGKMYVCFVCGKSIGSLDLFKEHVRKRHPAKALAIDSAFRIPDSVFFHFCAFCRMAFSTPDDKVRHFENVHRDKMPKELSILKCHISQTLDRDKMRTGLGSKHYRTSKGAKNMKQFHCDVCNTKLANKTETIDHIKNHFSRRRQFTCQR